MKLSEIKGENAIDALAELLEPLTVIATDEEIKEAFERTRLEGVQLLLTKHKKSVIEMLATLNQQTVEEYLEHLNLAKLPMEVFDLLEDEDLQELFT